jgi:hypothetical protein
MNTVDTILQRFGLRPPCSAPGRYYTTCPKCSAARTRAHQKSECLGITIDDQGVQFGCNHCDFKGGALYKPNGAARDPFVAVYDYFDENGKLLFQVCRTADKQFPQRRPDGNGGWAWGTKGVRKVLFHLNEVTEAIANGHAILIVEGEKDVLNLERIGLPATCNPGGASEPDKKPKWRKDYSEVLRGADIIIIPDHDPAGYAHADAIAGMSSSLAKSVRILKLADHWPDCPKGGDISDWLAAGHTREQLDVLIERAIETKGDQGKTATEQQTANWNWRFHGDVEATDSRPWLVELFIPETGTGLISGQWGTYKTFVAISLAVAVMTGGIFIKFPVMRKGAVLFIALEGENEIAIRLEAAIGSGPPGKMPFAWITECPRLLDPDAPQQLAAMVKEAAERMLRDFGLPVVLVIIDTMGKGAGYSRAGDENDSVIAKTVEKALAVASKETGAFFLGLDHFGKDPSTGTRGSSGKEDHTDVVLSLLGDKAQSGAVTNMRLCARKRRSGPNGEEFPFRAKLFDMGFDPRGTPMTTLIIDWTTAPDGSTQTKPKDDQWSKSLRLLRQTLMTMLVDCGNDLRPFADGPIVRAVDEEIIRKEFYASYLADGTPEQKAAAKQKAFRRAVNDAQTKGLIGARVVDGKNMIWLAQGDPTKNA